MSIRTLILFALIVALTAGAGWLFSPQPAGAQGGPDIWSNPKNLKVLPKDIDPQTLRGIMVGSAQGLGVRCWFCHVGEEGQDLSTFDFTSDEKKMKQIGREMLAMTMRINQETMPAVAKLEGEEEAAQVRCITCHRGEVKPSLDKK